MRATLPTSIRPARRPIGLPTANAWHRRTRAARAVENRATRRAPVRGAGNNTPVAVNQRSFAGEFVAEIDGSLSVTEADELARRHGLARVASENFPLIGATFGLFRITDGRPAETVRREFAADGSVRSVSRTSATRSRTRNRPYRPRAILRNMRWQNSACRRRMRWRTEPTLQLP